MAERNTPTGGPRPLTANCEELHPGISAIIEELRQKNAGWTYAAAVAYAKEEWHKRNPAASTGGAMGCCATGRLPKPESRTITRAELEAMYPPSAPMQPNEAAALERLLAIADSDTGQSRRVANFLLAWWNASRDGGFDLTDLWAVDTAIAQDMTTVFCLVARVHSYPDTLGYGARFEPLVEAWRPKGGAR
ncbi:hypothetical protein ACFOLC_00185 [Lysobacter cavernae]|uniref:DUF7673 domain-containing protein n=1 Tax=Lysobacter cavernae TaxID=1685901 RepID=A0ABV7RL80_9GAMM